MVNETSSTAPSFFAHTAFALVKIVIQIEPLIQLTTVIKGDTKFILKIII